MKCHRCGKENPAEVHTCSFLALLLADELYRHGATKTPRTVADELVRMHNEIEALRADLLKCKHEAGSPETVWKTATDALARAGEKK
jgi:hypothetical protein